MWTITDEQLDRISRSMRMEFEYRAFYVLSKEERIKVMSEYFVKDNIHKQMDRIIEYGIKDENLAMQFIRSSFEYPILQDEVLDGALVQALSNPEINEEEKMGILSNYLSDHQKI